MKRAVHRFSVGSVDSREGGLSRGKKRGTILEYLAVLKLYSVLLVYITSVYSGLVLNESDHLNLFFDLKSREFLGVNVNFFWKNILTVKPV